MAGLKKRILFNGTSTFYGMAVITLGQLATVPLFLSMWGPRLYGEWLVLMAIPTYLAMSDMGLGPVAANRIAMLTGKADRVHASVTLQTIMTFQLILAVAVIVAASLAVMILPLQIYLGISTMSIRDFRFAFVGLTCGIFLTMSAGIFQAMYRSVERNARGVMRTNTIRLMEVLGLIAALALGGRIAALVSTMLIVRFAGLVWMGCDVRRQAPDMPLGFSRFSLTELRSMLKPATGQLTFALANGLQVQGFTLLTNHLLGPVAVATYNVMRTLTRTCYQAVLVVNWSVYPEFSTLVAKHMMNKARELHRIAVQCSLWGSLLFCGFLLAAAPILIPLWTRGKIINNPPLLAVFSIGVVINSFWSTSSVVLTSTNNQTKLGYIYMVAAVVSLAMARLVATRAGLTGLAASGVLAEVAMMSYVLSASSELLHDSFGPMLVDILTMATLRRRGFDFLSRRATLSAPT